MTLWILPILPVALGGLIWLAPRVVPPGDAARGRRRLGGLAVSTLAVTLGLAAWLAAAAPTATLGWGPGLTLTLEVTAAVRVAMVLVPAIALPVALWAAAHEPDAGLARLLGLLVAFVGGMELLVLAADLLALAIAWELVAAVSWLLIAHHWREDAATGAAAYAFNASRIGGLGLWLAAAAALAVTGGFAFDGLGEAAASPWGHALAAGVLLAAASKSAQGPFAPWLFRAMEGPTSVSALLHSSTMVAAGAWLLIRLAEPLGAVAWFGPAAIGLGMATALAGGLVAAVQPHAKRLLAASTSAQYGLMLAAVGAGHPGAALAHLVAHAGFKALLFLVAGSAITAAGSERLADMRLGAKLPGVAMAAAVGALALAAIPPLGGAWTKEQIVAATGAVAPWLAIATIAAGALSAWYAARFHLLAFGRKAGDRARAANPAVLAAVAFLALPSIGLGGLWLPGAKHAAEALLPGELPPGHLWELIVSVASATLAAGAAWLAYARGRLAPPPVSPAARAFAAEWLGLPAAVRSVVVRPAFAGAEACARFDDRVVDSGLEAAARAGRFLSTVAARVVETGFNGAIEGLAALTRWSAGAARVVETGFNGAVEGLAALTRRSAGASRRSDDHGIDAAVRAVARGIGSAARESRRAQTGAVPTYYSLLVGGLLLLALVLVLGR